MIGIDVGIGYAWETIISMICYTFDTGFSYLTVYLCGNQFDVLPCGKLGLHTGKILALFSALNP